MLFCKSLWLKASAKSGFPVDLTLATPRSCVQFPGKARTDKNVNVHLEMQCKSLWIKASAKCIKNVNK